MLDHFDLIASIYDRLIGPPDTERLQQLLKLPTDGWLLDGCWLVGGWLLAGWWRIVGWLCAQCRQVV